MTSNRLGLVWPALPVISQASGCRIPYSYHVVKTQYCKMLDWRAGEFETESKAKARTLQTPKGMPHAEKPKAKALPPGGHFRTGVYSLGLGKSWRGPGLSLLEQRSATFLLDAQVGQK